MVKLNNEYVQKNNQDLNDSLQQKVDALFAEIRGYAAGSYECEKARDIAILKLTECAMWLDRSIALRGNYENVNQCVPSVSTERCLG